MSGAPIRTHQPCPRPECGSSDAAVIFADGGSYCYACQKGSAGDARAVDVGARAPTASGLVACDVQALPKRGIDQETAELWKVGYGTHRGEKTQIFQYLDAKGRVVCQKLKYAGKRFELVGDTKRLGLYGKWLWSGKGRMVTVVEGELDAVSLSQIQNNKWAVVSVPNGAASAAKAIAADLEWLDGYERVVLLFDSDEPGQAAALEAAAVLPPGKAFIGTIPGHKDANEALMALDSKKAISAIWDAKAWRPDGVVSTEDVWQKLLQGGAVHGFPIPHEGIMKATRGLRPAELTLLLSATGGGKSTLCREWAASLALAGHKVGYIGLEESVDRSLIGLLSVAVSRPLHLEAEPDLKAPDVLAAYDRLRPNLCFYDAFGSLDPDHLLGKLRFLARGEGCKVIVLDHVSIVSSGGELALDERRVLDRLMTKLAAFVQETRVHVLAVAHLSRREGTTHEDGRQIRLADIRGSHGLAQLSHTIIGLERDQQGDEANVSTVRVLKNRHAGVTGVVGEIEYNPTTGRQMERVTQFDSPFPSDSGDLA